MVSFAASTSSFFSMMAWQEFAIQCSTYLLAVHTLYTPFIVLVVPREKWYFAAITVVSALQTCLSIYASAGIERDFD